MTWERALEADARLAARNAVLIRAAIRQSFDAERAFTGYQNTTPDLSLTLPQQRSRARSWAIMNIRPNLEPLRQVLIKIWADAYALGDLAAREALRDARQAQKAEYQSTVDWSKWKPGDASAALILKPPQAFLFLLQDAGITLKGFNATTLTDIGNSIGEAIKLGLDARASAKLISNHVASPARALSIAITEQNRAISAATLQRYAIDGIREVEWLVFEPCKICAGNANKKVRINAPFPSGNTQPPAHPNCRCALAPVIPGMDDPANTAGSITTPVITPPAPVASQGSVTRAELTALLQEEFVPGEWRELSRAEIKERITAKIRSRLPDADDRTIEAFLGKPERALLKKGYIYVNGPVEVRFYSAGASVPAEQRLNIVNAVDELQTYNPKGRVTITVGPTKRNAHGWAYLGGDQIWVRPETAKMTAPNPEQGGKFKMPALATNPQWHYTLSHEWGHHIDDGDPWNGQTRDRKNAITKLKADFPEAFRSEYAMEKPQEFIAEMFVEYWLSDGKTDNEMVLAAAQQFGWKV